VKDPRLTILDLLKTFWELPWRPTFTTDWYQGEEHLPQVNISHVITSPKQTGFSMDPSQAQRRHQGVYNVDAWSLEQEQRWEMVTEVDRIVHERCNKPAEELEFIEVKGWRDLDEPDHPRLFRSQLRLEALYYG